MRALQAKAWPTCHRCGEAGETRCRCNAPPLEVLPDTDRLCAEGRTALFRPGRFQDARGNYHTCPICLATMSTATLRRGVLTPHCKRARCASEYKKAVRHDEARRHANWRKHVMYRVWVEKGRPV